MLPNPPGLVSVVQGLEFAKQYFLCRLRNSRGAVVVVHLQSSFDGVLRQLHKGLHVCCSYVPAGECWPCSSRLHHLAIPHDHSEFSTVQVGGAGHSTFAYLTGHLLCGIVGSIPVHLTVASKARAWAANLTEAVCNPALASWIPRPTRTLVEGSVVQRICVVPICRHVKRWIC